LEGEWNGQKRKESYPYENTWIIRFA
jgi:hypothetical protein